MAALKRMMINVSEAEIRAIKGRAIATQQSLSAVVREALRLLFGPEEPKAQ